MIRGPHHPLGCHITIKELKTRDKALFVAGTREDQDFFPVGKLGQSYGRIGKEREEFLVGERFGLRLRRRLCN